MFILLSSVVLSVLLSSTAQAHPLDVAYLDFSSLATSTTLTVALHPYQAFEIVRAGTSDPFSLARLSEKRALLAAYVESHVDVSDLDGKSCVWNAEESLVPKTELEAVADGITFSGSVQCPTMARALRLQTDLFLSNFPTQSNIVRLEQADGFQELITLHAKEQSVLISLDAPMSPLRRAPESTNSAWTTQIANRLTLDHLPWWEWVLVMILAAGVGLLHALGPGHGKGLMAAMLVGERATWRHAILLGLVMTVTHVADVFLLALIASAAIWAIPPLQMLQWLQYLSAFGLIGLGSWSLVRSIWRLRRVIRDPVQASSDEAHHRAHLLGLPHGHEEDSRTDQVASRSESASFRRILWMGVVGSLAPCPTAWAMFMGTVALGKPFAGIAILVSFTVGLQVTIVVIGLLVVSVRRFVVRKTNPRWTYLMPVLSALCVFGIGVLALASL